MVLRDLYASGKKKSKASCKHQRCNKDRNRRESKNSDSDHYQKRNKKSSCATSSVSSSYSHRKTSRPVAVNSSRHSKRHAKGKIDEVYEESRDRITAVIPYLDGGDYSEVFYDQKVDSNIRDESVPHRRKGRYRRQTIRLPDEPTRRREVRRRLLTPEPDILERIFLQRQGQDIIEEIIEEPSTPPPRIEERIIYEQSEPPQLTRKVVRVQPSQPVSQHEAVQSTNHHTNQITNTNGASHTTMQGQQTIPQGGMQPASSVAPLPESALNNFRIEIGSTGTTPGAFPISQPPLTNYGVNPQYTDGSGPISAFATSLGYGPSSNAGGIGQTSFGGLPDSISSNGGGALGFSGNFGGGQLSSLANNFAMSCCGGMGGLSMGAGFGAPMGGFGSSMGGFGSSMGGFGSAGLPFGGMGSASFGSFPGFAGGASFGGGMACPSMPPPMACAPPPQIIQQPVPCPVPVPVPQQVPCPVPVPVPQQIPCPVPVPIREAVPVPQPCPVPVPVPVHNVQIRPIPVPVPQPYPVPCPVPVDRVVCQPVMVPVPQPVPQPCPVPVPQPCPVPVPVPGPVQHVPVPVPQPCPVPVPQPCPVPVSVPSPPQCVPVPVPVPVCAPPPPACPMPNPCASFGGGLASYGAGFGASLPPMMGAGLGSYGAPIGGFGGSLGIGGGLPGGCGGSLGIGGGLPGMFGGLSGGFPGLGALPPMGGLGGYGGGLGGISGVPIGFGVTTTVGLGNQLPGNMLGGGIPYGAGIPGAFTDFSSVPRSFQNGPHRRF